MDKLDNYVSKPPVIVGSTTINHEARVRLGLNCSEYCLLDHLSRKDDKNSQADTLTVYISTGFTQSEVERLFRSLIQKGYVYITGEKYELTSKWADAFADIEKEFDNLFWRKDKKVAWTGTHKKALEYYVKLRKKYSMEFLVSQRDKYFEYLILQLKLRNFDQQKVMCQVFLNPSTERFLEDYDDYLMTLKKRYGDPAAVKTEPITKEQVLNSYGKNNNQ